ncbi:S8 family peptidase [Marinoscillum furvescens]|uniref:S8 family peptidase n=1 Tax=Marinoscillum furvescens TaxID=1026 RepID=UPI001C87CDE7|nr:S8 family peptidase [Marinoscillum furvescens]
MKDDYSKNRTSGPYLLRFNGEVDLFSSEFVQENILRKLDDKTLILKDYVLLNENIDQVQWYVANNLWKISENILKETFFQESKFLIHFLSFDIVEQVKSRVNVLSVNDDHLTMRVRCTRNELFQLADMHGIRFISRESQDPVEEARVLDLNLNPNAIPRARILAPDANGDHVTISVQERRFDPDDLDLIGRSFETGREFESQNNHATEMATIIAGAGNSFVTGAGVLPAATLTSSSFAEVLPMPDSYYTTHKIVIQNHSYGTTQEGFYGIQAQAFDRSMHQNPQLLHLLSTGNVGAEPSSDGPYEGVTGYANLTGNFKHAKNPVVVGAVDTLGRVLDYSSRGPAFDGRIKPELVAYSMFGSSNATALVSGIVGMLQDEYFRIWGDWAPSALVKALLIAGADDLDEPGPDHIRGYGNANAAKSMELLQEQYFFAGELSANDTVSYTITSEAPADLTVALVWLDAPANPGDAPALVNDLDLEVMTPAAEVLHPWVLETSADEESLGLSASRGVDRLNPVEVVSQHSVPAGEYVIKVKGSSIRTASQQFYVVYRLDPLNEFSWEYPVVGSHFPYNGETGTYFRWKSSLSESAGSLHVNVNNEGWQVLNDEVLLSREVYRWQPDLSQTGTAVARMLVGLDTFLADTFQVSRALPLTVGINCGDSVLVQWPQQPNIEAYAVQALQGAMMQTINFTPDTLVLLKKNLLTEGWVKVQPMVSGNAQPLPSAAIRYDNQGAGCIIQSFYQEVVADTGVYLNVRLGTTYGVEAMSLYDLRQSDSEPFFRIENPQQTTWRIQQEQPSEGHNRHRVTLHLANGQMLSEETMGGYYFSELPYVVFPNPVPQNDFVRVYTRAFDGEVVFELLDTQGNRVYRKQLLLSQVSIPLSGLRAGLYTYRLSAGTRTYSGKLLIE